jgi:hypothetical protein
VAKLTSEPDVGWASLGLEVLRASDFDGPRLRREGRYAVCFGATWCFPTRVFAPKFAARNTRVPARLAMADISARDDPLWDSFQISITPTMIVFQDGGAMGRFNGRPVIGLRTADVDRMVERVNTLARAGSG